MRRTRTTLGIALALLTLAVSAASAADGGTSDDPSVLHIPPADWMAGEPMTFRADVENDWRVARIWLSIRATHSNASFEELEMRRTPANHYAATLPSEAVQPPGVEYFISVETTDGLVASRFADAEAPQAVAVVGETAEMRLADRLARHHGNRSALSARAEMSFYGASVVENVGGATGGETRTEAGSNRYWTTELAYRYRVLSLLYDIHFGIGFLRGERPTTLRDGASVPVDPNLPRPGLNHGYGGITVEPLPYLSFEADLIFGAHEDGFAAGIGGLLRIGRIGATRLEVGGEFVSHSGNEGFFRFAWDTVPRVPMALGFELTTRPDGDTSPLATRVLYDIGFEISPAIVVDARVGFATRTTSIEGGPVVGLGTTFSF